MKEPDNQGDQHDNGKCPVEKFLGMAPNQLAKRDQGGKAVKGQLQNKGGGFFLKGVLSRKKQVVPVLYEIITRENMV